MKRVVKLIGVMSVAVSCAMAGNGYFTLFGGSASGDIPSQARYGVGFEGWSSGLKGEAKTFVWGTGLGMAYGKKGDLEYFDMYADVRLGTKVSKNALVYGIVGVTGGSLASNDAVYGFEGGVGARYFLRDYRFEIGVDYKYSWNKDDAGLDPTMHKIMGVVGFHF